MYLRTQDYLLPSEIVNALGQLTANGLRIERAGQTPGPLQAHMLSNHQIGLGWHAYFMVDFPVYIWRDMLTDFRAHVTQYVFRGSNSSREATGELHEFWRAAKHLVGKGWIPSEYTNLLQFAYESPKWRHRYDWHIVGDYHHPILSHASHYRGLGCTRPQSRMAQISTPVQRANETKGALFFPTGHSPINSQDQMRSYRVSGWVEYASLRDTDEWSQYLVERQVALREYSSAHGNAVSAADVCGASVIERWSSCFVQLRQPGMEWCDGCASDDSRTDSGSAPPAPSWTPVTQLASHQHGNVAQRAATGEVHVHERASDSVVCHKNYSSGRLVCG